MYNCGADWERVHDGYFHMGFAFVTMQVVAAGGSEKFRIERSSESGFSTRPLAQVGIGNKNTRVQMIWKVRILSKKTYAGGILAPRTFEGRNRVGGIETRISSHSTDRMDMTLFLLH